MRIGSTNGSKDFILLFFIVVFCIFEDVLSRQSEVVREYEAAFLSLNGLMVICLAFWSAALLIITGTFKDMALTFLLFTVIIAYYFGTPSGVGIITILAGVTLGKSTFVLLRCDEGENDAAQITRHSSLVTLLVGLVVLLAFSSWWHLDATGAYHGPRWIGLWDNPNTYGMLMGAGVVLAVGLLAAGWQMADGRWQKLIRIILTVAAFMMGVGLLFSYSRGAWVGMVVGLLYLAKANGKFKWRWVLPPVLIILVVVFFFWNNTSDNAPWYLKRLDLSRASAQHRIVAWKAGFEIMRDHPFGVGWNKTVDVYQKNYSPPEGGAAAIATNDYLMLGTQLGIPALLCFFAYVALCLRGKCRIENEEGRIQVICRAGAIVLLVAFWFDGGLFKLATAAVFWILLELSQVRSAACGVRNAEPVQKSKIENRQSEIGESLVTSSPTKTSD